MGQALRIFYRKSDERIVWSHETRSPEGVKVVCPSTIEEDLSDIPSKIPDGETPLGGMPSDYGCIEVKEANIDAFFASDSNKVVKGKLKIGNLRPEPEPEPEPEPARDPLAEIDKIKARLKEKGIL